MLLAHCWISLVTQVFEFRLEICLRDLPHRDQSSWSLARYSTYSHGEYAIARNDSLLMIAPLEVPDLSVRFHLGLATGLAAFGSRSSPCLWRGRGVEAV